jgi:hypothetical protein
VGIEWFRDLSITILGFVTSVVLIFGAILGYRLYQKTQSTLSVVRQTAQVAHEAVSQVQAVLNTLLPILAVIQGIRGGIETIGNMFKQENCHKEKSNE